MRHLRVSNQNGNKLSTFKKQIADILQKINTFDEADRSEAVNYVQQFIDINNRSFASRKAETETSSDVHENTTKKVVSLTVPKKIVPPHTRKRRKSVLNKPRKGRKHVSVKPWLKCKICNESKKTKLLLLKHMALHIGSPMSCTVCHRTFNNRLSFDWHLKHLCAKKKMLHKIYQCLECPLKFGSPRSLNLHMDGHKRNNCSYCDTVLNRREHLIQHMLDVHKIKLERSNFNCNHCDKRFVKRQSLYHHLRQHLPNKLICMECGAAMDTTELYNDHIKKHDEQKPWQCSQCKDKFSRRQQYIYHLRRHDRYKCLTCKENFASKIYAHKHRRNGHLVQGLEPRLHCPHCPAAFHRTLLLQMHIRKHKEDTTTIRCKFCDKTFHTPYRYYKHCKTTLHDKNSPEISQLVCENCGKQFTKKYVLEQHLKRFHGAKHNIFSCKYCNYQTQFKPNLERHMNLHFSDQKQYICDHCGKSFSNIPSLTDHINYTHLQEKQFKCGECEKSFKRNSELVRHQSCHSDARPHVCHLCGQSYKRVNHLRRHQESAHAVMGKSKKVQRLKTDSTGAVVPVLVEEKKCAKEKKAASKQKTIDPIYSLENIQPIPYFDNTVSVINSVSLAKIIGNENLMPLDANSFSQQEFWSDKLSIELDKPNSVVYNTDSTSLTQTFNMVDQFVKSFLPTKNLQILDCPDYNEYPTNIALEYANIPIPTITKEGDILTENGIGINDINVTWQ